VQEPTTLPVVTTAPTPAPPAAKPSTVPTTASPSITATPSTTAPQSKTPSQSNTTSSGDAAAADPAGGAAGAPCSLPDRTASQTVPVIQVCPSAGVPHFDTPQAAMAYLANAWNTGNVQQIDYVTDPNGRAQLDSMASVMVNLRFDHCTSNPAGDATCYFMHDVIPSTSPTTYPNPMNYPPGEAVFTVAPAATPGWYLTEVIHCG